MRGLGECIATEVKVQRASVGEPLDDIIVSGVGHNGSTRKISLQVKQSLVLSSASSNVDFRSIIQNSWKTMQKDVFQREIDRVGGATGNIAVQSFRDFTTICERAHWSATCTDYFACHDGHFSQSQKDMVQTVRTLLGELESGLGSNENVFLLLRHFILIRFESGSSGDSGTFYEVERLRSCLSESATANVHALWNELRIIARDMAGLAASLNRQNLISAIQGEYNFNTSKRYSSDLARLAEHTKGVLMKYPM